MKQVILKRAWTDARATIGMLTIVGVKHDPFFTLENPQRSTTKDSRIPGGFYKCVPYSGSKHKDVYQILDVPGRTAILFHVGNYEYETEGCILVGSGSCMMMGRPAITDSRAAFKMFKHLLGNTMFELTIV